MKKIIKYGCYALLAVFCLYQSHKKVYWVGWNRGGRVILEYVNDSLQVEVDKKRDLEDLKSYR